MVFRLVRRVHNNVAALGGVHMILLVVIPDSAVLRWANAPALSREVICERGQRRTGVRVLVCIRVAVRVPVRVGIPIRGAICVRVRDAIVVVVISNLRNRDDQNDDTDNDEDEHRANPQ